MSDPAPKSSFRLILAISIFMLVGLGGLLFYVTKQFAALELSEQKERANQPHVTGSNPAADERDVAPVAAISADVSLPSGKGVDPATLEKGIQLLRVSDGTVVPSQKNTSGSGDSLALTPVNPLEKDTQYKFVVTRDLKDTAGVSFAAYSVTFTTAKNFEVVPFPAAFEKVEMKDVQLEQNAFTSMAIGPDGLFYAGSAGGLIYRYEIKPDGTLAAREPVMTVLQRNQGPRLITGIAFDPASTADNPIIWVNHGQLAVTPDGRFEGADDWTGKLSRLFGKGLDGYDDVLIGLPRAFKDHMSFQLTFGKDGNLYFAQGSNTSVGDVDKKWGFRPERKLTAAILRLDVWRIPPPHSAPKSTGAASTQPSTTTTSSTGNVFQNPEVVGIPVDVKTDEGGSYGNSEFGAQPLGVYATGVRSAFHILQHSNGHLYSGVNGAGGNEGNTPASPDGKIPAVRDIKETTADTLINIKPGKYYGHPNPTRGQYVLNGGNPSAGVDPMEIREYPVGTMPDANFQPAAYVFGKNMSPNGLIEYRASKFGGALSGCILVARYSIGDDIVALRLNPEGEVIERIEGIDGFTQFLDPLDLLEDPKTGNIYVAEYRGQRISLLRPVESKPSTQTRRTAVTPASSTPDR